MISYAIKIDGKYFKEYVYAEDVTKNLYSGHTYGGLSSRS